MPKKPSIQNVLRRYADLNPPLGVPGGSCYLQDRIKRNVRNPRNQKILLDRHLLEQDKGGRGTVYEQAIYGGDHPEGRVKGTSIKRLQIDPHAQYRMDQKGVSMAQVHDLLKAFQKDFVKDTQSGYGPLLRELQQPDEFRYEHNGIRAYLRSLRFYDPVAWKEERARGGKPGLELHLRTVHPIGQQDYTPTPPEQCARTANASNVAMQSHARWAQESREAYEEFKAQVDKYRGQKGVTYFRRDPFDLQMAAMKFYRATQRWVAHLIDNLSIPARQAKGVEMLARLFNRARLPKDSVKWHDTNARRWATLLKTYDWGVRQEGDEGMFQIGPFTVHNTVGASGRQLEKIRRVVEKAARLARDGTTLPGFARTLGGHLYIVGKIGRPKWAAWYMPQKDAVYLRANIRGISEDETVRHLIHELGHRYKAKFIDPDLWRRWTDHHRQMSNTPPSVEMPEVGDVLPFPVNNKDAKVAEASGTSYTLVNKETGEPLGRVGRRKMHSWLRDAAHRMSFPTLYAFTDPEEHLMEALSMKATGTLPQEHEEAYDRIVSGGSSAPARVAYRYALKMAPEPGVKTLVTDKSQKDLPTNVDREQQVNLPLPGSATPGGAGRDIAQFSYNAPDSGSNIKPRTLSVPGEEYGNPSNDTYNTVTRRIVESHMSRTASSKWPEGRYPDLKSYTDHFEVGEDGYPEWYFVSEGSLSAAPDYGTSDAALPRGKKASSEITEESEEGTEKTAYKRRWQTGVRQRRTRGSDRTKRRMYNRKNRQKRKMQSKRWRRKNRNNPAYKAGERRRRSQNRTRRASVLTVPDIAFVIGPEMLLGYVHSISSMSGMVTIELDETNVSQLDSLPIELFLRMAVFLSDEDIEAFYDLVDVEIGLDAYGDLDEQMVRECAARYDRDPDADDFKSDCFDLTGEHDLRSMAPNQLEAVTLILVGDRDLRSREDADDEGIPEAFDPDLYYGEVGV